METKVLNAIESAKEDIDTFRDEIEGVRRLLGLAQKNFEDGDISWCISRLKKALGKLKELGFE